MNPIPLAAPDGRVYAYACGHCHQVSGGSSVLYLPDEPGPIDVLVETSLINATSCCLCRTCGIVEFRRFTCESCTAWWQFCVLWSQVSAGYEDKPCAICGVKYTSRYCRETPACIDCGEDHGGNAGRCRDCNLEHLWSDR